MHPIAAHRYLLNSSETKERIKNCKVCAPQDLKTKKRKPHCQGCQIKPHCPLCQKFCQDESIILDRIHEVCTICSIESQCVIL